MSLLYSRRSFSLSGGAQPVRPTLADVASAAGVHPTTVSLALRNSSRLPEKTKEKLCELAQKMGYQPDPRMQALVAYRRRGRGGDAASKLAVLHRLEGGLKGTVWQEAVEGAAEAAGLEGFQLEEYRLEEGRLTLERALDVMMARGISGVLVLPGTAAPLSSPSSKWSGVCAVGMGYEGEITPWHCVTPYLRGSIDLCVRELARKGYRRVAVVGSFAQEIAKGMLGLDLRAVFDVGDIDRAWLQRTGVEVLVGDVRPLADRLEALGITNGPLIIGIGDLDGGRYAGVGGQFSQIGEVAVGILANMVRLNQTGLPATSIETRVKGRWLEVARQPEAREPLAAAWRNAS